MGAVSDGVERGRMTKGVAREPSRGFPLVAVILIIYCMDRQYRSSLCSHQRDR